MYIETEIRNAVQTYSGLSAEKVSLTSAQEGTQRPYIVISTISHVRHYTHSGYDGMTESRFQIDIYGSTYEQSKLLAKSVLDIDQYTSTQIHDIEVLSMMDGFDNTADNYTNLIDVMVRHYNS